MLVWGYMYVSLRSQYTGILCKWWMRNRKLNCCGLMLNEVHEQIAIQYFHLFFRWCIGV